MLGKMFRYTIALLTRGRMDRASERQLHTYRTWPQGHILQVV